MLLAIAVLSSGVPHRLRHESSVMELEREAELELDGLAPMLKRMDKMEKLIESLTAENEEQAAEIQLLKADQIAVRHSLARPTRWQRPAFTGSHTGTLAHQAQALEVVWKQKPKSKFVVKESTGTGSCDDDGEYSPPSPPTCEPRPCHEFPRTEEGCPKDRCKIGGPYKGCVSKDAKYA